MIKTNIAEQVHTTAYLNIGFRGKQKVNEILAQIHLTFDSPLVKVTNTLIAVKQFSRLIMATLRVTILNTLLNCSAASRLSGCSLGYLLDRKDSNQLKQKISNHRKHEKIKPMMCGSHNLLDIGDRGAITDSH